jgi:hypothetical protein
MCLVCGAPVEIAGVDDLVGKKLAGGEANPAALARPTATGGARSGRAGSGRGTKSGAGRKTTATRSTAARRAG